MGAPPYWIHRPPQGIPVEIWQSHPQENLQKDGVLCASIQQVYAWKSGQLWPKLLGFCIINSVARSDSPCGLAPSGKNAVNEEL